MATFPTGEQAPLPAAWYARPVEEVARDLPGCVLLHETDTGCTAGIIVETEAYGADDPASHAFRGQTPRNAPMFAPGGTIYVYRSYGIHWCLNVATGSQDHGAAVLLRALEPLAGLEEMARRRGFPALGPHDPHALCSGPGKLTQAMGVDASHNRGLIWQGPLRVVPGPTRALPHAVMAAPRIGISRAKDVLWRFCIVGNKFVSLPRPRAN